MTLPVFKTIGQVFGFVIERRFFTLLRIIWFPAILSVVSSLMEPLYVYVHMGILPHKVEKQLVGFNVSLNALDADPVLGTIQIVDGFLQLVLGAIIAVSVHRIILKDDEQPGEFFYLRFTGEELRYVFCGILYSLLAAVAFMAPFAMHVWWVVTKGASIPFQWSAFENVDVTKSLLTGPAIIPVGVLSVIFLLIALARFGLTFPIIVAEERMSFLRSWELTRGNTLRLIGFWILTTVLAAILIFLLIAVIGAALAGMWLSISAGGNTGGAVGVLVLAAPAAAAALTYLVVGLTLFIAAMSYSYKALSDGDADGSI